MIESTKNDSNYYRLLHTQEVESAGPDRGFNAGAGIASASCVLGMYALVKDSMSRSAAESAAYADVAKGSAVSMVIGLGYMGTSAIRDVMMVRRHQREMKSL